MDYLEKKHIVLSPSFPAHLLSCYTEDERRQTAFYTHFISSCHIQKSLTFIVGPHIWLPLVRLQVIAPPLGLAGAWRRLTGCACSWMWRRSLQNTISVFSDRRLKKMCFWRYPGSCRHGLRVWGVKFGILINISLIIMFWNMFSPGFFSFWNFATHTTFTSPEFIDTSL